MFNLKRKFKIWVEQLVRDALNDLRWWDNASSYYGVRQIIRASIDDRVDKEVKDLLSGLTAKVKGKVEDKVAAVDIKPADIRRLVEQYYAINELNKLVNKAVDGEQFIDDVVRRINNKQIRS